MRDTRTSCVCVRRKNELKSLPKRSMLRVFDTFPLSLCVCSGLYFLNRTFYLILAYKLLKSCSCWHSNNRWCFEGENILLHRRGIRLELSDMWTWTVRECMRLLRAKTTFINSNSYPVSLDEWRDVTWSLVKNAILVLAKTKWENMTICLLDSIEVLVVIRVTHCWGPF